VRRIEPAARRFAWGVALLLPAIGVGGTLLQLAGVIHRSLSPAGMLANSGGLLAISLSIWWGASRRVTLFSDAIEVSDWLSSRKLRRDEIRSRRIGRGGRFRLNWYHVLVPARTTDRCLLRSNRRSAHRRLEQRLADGAWLVNQFAYVLEDLARYRNPAAHREPVGLEDAARLRAQLLGVGCYGDLVRLAGVRAK
jgi:hypothetical protein